MADTSTIDQQMMRRCLALATSSGKLGEYPYGAVITRNGEIVAESTNRVARDLDITRHAEIVAISEAQRVLRSTSLDDCALYASTEPCAFCCYAVRESRIAKVVYGLRAPITGGISRWNILADRTMSDRIPEIFAPPPVVLHCFLCEEADAALEQASPIAWAFIRSRGLLDLGPQDETGSRSRDASGAAANFSNGGQGLSERLMRVVRNRFLDRFGRGGRIGGRRARRQAAARAGSDSSA
jgi:tRNA(adenine34) deaminase